MDQATPRTTARNDADSSLAAEEKPWILAHLSDPHLACMVDLRLRELRAKQLFSWLRWQGKRRHRQDDRLLTTLGRELQDSAPDHIAITGDFCHLSLPAEFAAARDWLASLGDPQRCSIVFGNHDQYVATNWQKSWGLFLPWLQEGAEPAASLSPKSPHGNPLHALFPTLQLRGNIALIGVNTARPTALHLATGAIGPAQLARLDQLLLSLQGQDLCRILLLHHPPLQGVLSRRRSLDDGAALRSLVKTHGVELILCGHAHHRIVSSLPGPTGPIPVFVAASITSTHKEPAKRSSYTLFNICKKQNAWQIAAGHRLLAADGQSYFDEPDWEQLSPLPSAGPLA